jgi:hypothetical protein
MALKKAKASTTTHSQVVARKKLHPSRRSCSVLVCSSLGGLGGILTGTRSTVETSQAIALTASPQPGPTVTTSRALRDGPMIVRPPRVSDISALAG